MIGADGSATDFAVTGGFVEINGDSVSLLAERGHRREEITHVGFPSLTAVSPLDRG